MRDSREGAAISPEIQAGWSAGIKRYDDRWTVEMAVPFRLLGGNPPRPDNVWGLNLNGSRGVNLEGAGYGWTGWTCWSDTKGAFATPNRFGRLVFTDYTLWLRCHYAVLTRNLMDEITDLMMRYPGAGKPLMPEISKLDGLWTDFLKQLSVSIPEVAGRQRELLATGDKVVAAYEEFLSRLRLGVIKTEFR